MPKLLQWIATAAMTVTVCASSQTMPPATVLPGTQRPENCDRVLLPLACADESGIKAFYQTNSWITPIQQVRFLYGLGNSANSVSADLATMIFPLGTYVALGTSMTSSGNSSAQAGSGSSASPEQALERLKAGGDFYVRAAYPLAAATSANKTAAFTLFSVSTLGFNVPNFGSGATVTEGTERNFNTSLEGFAQYAAIENMGKLFLSGRFGFQNVQTDFARAVGLPHRNFALGQLAAGVQFGDFVRIGFQKFFGPSQAYGVNHDELKQWHLVIQLLPLQAKK